MPNRNQLRRIATIHSKPSTLRMRIRHIAVSPVLLSFLLLGCGGSEAPQAQGEGEIAATVQALTIPQEFQAGEAAFNANCAVCHGERALGTNQGPPLVHIIYEPSHHADIAFVMAVDRGVRAHHWQFGDMPPLPDVENEQVLSIIGYIRFLQRQVGIM
jgi:mono/diheme cytochrome c family protein